MNQPLFVLQLSTCLHLQILWSNSKDGQKKLQWPILYHIKTKCGLPTTLQAVGFPLWDIFALHHISPCYCYYFIYSMIISHFVFNAFIFIIPRWFERFVYHNHCKGLNSLLGRISKLFPTLILSFINTTSLFLCYFLFVCTWAYTLWCVHNIWGTNIWYVLHQVYNYFHEISLYIQCIQIHKFV